MVQPADCPNLVTLFLHQAARLKDRPFLWHKDNGQWHALSWQDAAQQVADMAQALQSLGLAKGDRVALVSENRPQWCLADLAIMAAGCVSVPTYITNTERDHLHILENSGARAVFVSDTKLLRTLMPAVLQSSHCRHVIGFEPLKLAQSSGALIHIWDDLLARHKGDVQSLAHSVSSIGRTDLACLIYTSGTGGAPRGVRQHHGMILQNIAGCLDVILNDFLLDEQEVFLSFLPLSHAYEHTGGQYLPIGLGAQIYYAESLEKLAGNIEEVAPTIMVVVPRLFEVLRARIVRLVEKQGGVAPKLLAQAMRLGRQKIETGQISPLDRPLDWLLERTLRKKLRARFGGRMKAMVAGGAPLNPEVGIFFAALGLTLLQGYGQTEAGPVISVNRPSHGIKMHSVGRPLKDVEVRIAEDGEICVRGELVMQGYWNNEEESARVLQGGWLLTGDIGHIDEDGHIVITDRKKDIIVNDKGDNVAPQRIEGMLTLQPEIMQAMVSGDRRPYLVGLVVPDPEWATEWAQARGLGGDISNWRNQPEFHRAVMAAVDRVNAQLSVIEKVRRICIADEAFSVENEQLTPSMKVRRHVLRQVYGARLDAMYSA